MSGSSPPIRKKLIEVSIPLEAINAASAKEKSIRHGHPSTLHLWWARRPLAACKAVLFAQLVDDPSAWPDRFPTAESREAERKRLHEVIARMVPWEASNDEAILNEARWEIARSVAWGLGEEPPSISDPNAVFEFLQTKAPPVYDPFSGGGSIPLEAQRLGLRAFGSDLNPVAVLISKSLVEIPPSFSSLPPVNPGSTADRSLVGHRWDRSQGLADDVRWYGQWIRGKAEEKISHFYPKALLPEGKRANVIAWLWVRTVRSPDPAAKGAMVPLVSSWLLSAKQGKKTWIEPKIDQKEKDGYRFEVFSGAIDQDRENELRKGTKSARATFACLLTGAVLTGQYIDQEAQAGRMSTRLLAVVAEGLRSRHYCSPTEEHESAASAAASYLNDHHQDMRLPDQECRGTFASNAQGRRYCFQTFSDYFCPRQLIALSTFSDLVSECRQKILFDALAAGMPDDGHSLSNSGRGANAYADAVTTYLGLIVGRCTDAWSTVTSWSSTGEFIRNTFARQGITMSWDFAECNPFSSSTGNFNNGIEWTTDALREAPAKGVGQIFQLAAQKNNYPVPSPVFSTDPPYYDNIAYADLSDYFYVWHRRTLSEIWPELYRRLTVPKDDELVATPYRHGSRERADQFFLDGMRSTIDAMRKAASELAPLAIYYAFKQSEAGHEGIISAGWASFLQAVVDADLVIDGTWPIRTERAARTIGIGANALASSVVLVCRARKKNAASITRAEFMRELRRELPIAMEDIIGARIGPVDFEQAVIGPGMGIFSRYAKVLEEDDSSMSVRTALALINRVRLEVDAETGNFDPETQVALTWFHAHGYAEKTSGEAILLANAKGVALEALFSSGVFRDGHGRARLLKREELPSDWSPRTDRNATIWECVQHTARALDQRGSEAAAVLIKAMDRKADEALSLAYRLYDIANAKGEAMEARVYAELAAEWPELEALVATLPDEAMTPRSQPAQASLFV